MARLTPFPFEIEVTTFSSSSHYIFLYFIFLAQGTRRKLFVPSAGCSMFVDEFQMQTFGTMRANKSVVALNHSRGFGFSLDST
jgi:hypothetical protein